MSVSLPNLNDVQGDVLFGLPKQTQKFFFFKINEVDGFRTNLANLIPDVTSAEQTKDTIQDIKNTKARLGIASTKGDGETVHPPAAVSRVVTVNGLNIAFSATGLKAVGLTDSIGDSFFDAGQAKDMGNLGDARSQWEAEFLKQIDGVALITGDSHDTVDAKLQSVQDSLSSTVEKVLTLTGDVRPGDQAGHEHFGYKDGISQPAIIGLDTPKPGQGQVKPGVTLVGRDGDSVTTRPSWALDGSFMVFRKLKQLVPEFNKFLLDTAGNQTGADLMGARFVGRWKSGAPVMLSPQKDDPELGADDQRNNDFDFVRNDQSKCPFHAHIRKTFPRDGDFGDTFSEPHMIMRRGIPFGPEVGSDEKETTTQDRGLLFVCYQSNINAGFKTLQTVWANNDGFPVRNAGKDPLIGQSSSEGPRNITGAFADDVNKPLTLIKQWVDTKGGEYFFSPSIPTLRDLIAKKANGTTS